MTRCASLPSPTPSSSTSSTWRSDGNGVPARAGTAVPVIPAPAGIQGIVSRNLQIFAVCVAIWGSTWIAITFQLGRVSPEASVTYRFLLASVLLFAYCRVRGLTLRYTAREHAWIALQGLLMFSLGYIFVYYA